MRELRDRFISQNQNQSTIFSIASLLLSGWIILLPLCYLLYKPGDQLLFPAHN